jgi:DNA-binding MarR family transcriptional regulator
MKTQQIIGSPLEAFTRNMFTEIIVKLGAFMAQNHFSVSEIAALHIIDKHGRLPIQRIAEQIGLSASATSRLLAGLEKKKLLERQEDFKDSRIKYMSCSKVGRKFLDQLSLERTRAAGIVLANLPPQMTEQMFATIKDLQKGSVS